MIPNKKMRILTIICLLVASGIIVVFIGLQINTSAQIGQNFPGDPKSERARRRVVELDDPEWRQNVPLTALASQSRIIAIGVPLRNACNRSQDGNQVTTDYEVRIQEVIKGDVGPDSVISVSMPGGLVTEADRSLLEVRARPVRKMRNGRTYVLFLKNAHPRGNAAFTTVRGSQGIYEIPQNGSRVIHLGRSAELPPADDGEEISVFLQAVRLLADHP